MKKIFRRFMAIALAAMTFTACEDVPEPYAWPEANNGGTEGTVAGNGTETEPLTVEQAIAKASATGSWVTGYIVGANSGAPDYTFITDPTQITIASNIYIAATPTETDQSKCMPIQLPVGAVRTAINLADNKTVIGKQVTLYGDIDTYFSQPGLKNTSFVKIDDKEFGTKPSEGGEAPAVSAKNTIETALSVADMLKIIDALGEGETSADWYYVKGKIKNIKTAAADIAKYKNIDYFITDDGQNEVQIFRGKNLNNTDFTEAGQINVGDEVVVVGQPMKYKNANTGAIIPEIAQGNYIVKLTKGTGGDTPTPAPDVEITGKNLITNGGFESWTGGIADNWKSTTTASSATVSQSTTAKSGTYAIKVTHDASGNKRLAYKEITLKPGNYTYAFYVRASESTTSVRPGYTTVTDGKANSQYSYNDYVNDITTEWQQVVNTITLSEQTTLNLVIMVPKNAASDPIIDDVTLTTTDGGLVEGSEPSVTPDPTPTPTEGIFSESFANGQGTFTIDNKVLPSGVSYIWNKASYQNDTFMKASAYVNKTNYDAESWLISPVIDLSKVSAATLTFEQAINGFFGTIENEAMVYAKKEGGKWTKLNITHPAKPSSGYTSFVSQDVNLNDFAGSKMQIAFVYVGTSKSSGTWEVKGVVIK